MLTVAFGKYTMGRTQVQLWYNRFKEGREDVNAPSDRTSPSTTYENMKMILDYPRITIGELADGIAYRSTHAKKFFRMFWA